MMPVTTPAHADPSCGGRLVAVDPRTLPLTHAALSVDAGGGLARVVLEQRFHNPHDEPLVVTYSLPLPHDAVVGGFAFRVGDRRIVGEVDRRQQARERYERALVEGHTAALLEQERSTVFTQHIGNVPPGAEVVAEITLEQKLAWTDEGAWEWRFPTTVAPRYLGAPGRVPDADRVAQDVAASPMPVRMTFAVTVRDALDGRLPQSPSHALRAAGSGATRIEQADSEGVPLDRDVVVRWSAGRAEPGVRIETARGPDDAAYALLTLVPPARSASVFAAAPSGLRPTSRGRVARDLVLLLDVSGSMSGEPLAQAKRVVSALVATLDARDSLEMIAFASSPRRWKRGATTVTPDAKREAQAWIAGLSASGGTEMRHAIEEALAPLRADAQRQVVVVTDGQIGFESEVVATILARLPASSRVHVVGVGSAPNRTLTAGAPRAGRGVEVLVGLGEDAERAAARIVARTDAPVVVDVEIAGGALVDHAPARLPDLFAGAPALVVLKVREGELRLRGRTEGGAWEQRVAVPRADEHGRPGVPALYARERVEDLEMEIAAGGDLASLEARIERVGLDFGVATRATSWIAVSEERTVDPQAPVRRTRMPHELPHGMSAEGLGLRPAMFAGAPGAAGAATSTMVTRAGVLRESAGYVAAGRIPARPAPPSQAAPPPPPALGAPPPPPAPAVPGKGGAPFARARAAIGSLFGGRAGAAARSLAGTLAFRDSTTAVVEITLHEALDWAPPDGVAVTWADGTTTEVAVLTDRSTRAQRAAAGAAVKLALAITDARAIASIAFDRGGEHWTVTL